MQYIFTNRASSLLGSEIGTANTSISVSAGGGAKFPNPGQNQGFTMYIDGGGNREYMTCTGVSGDTLTVVRSGTPYSFPVGSKIVHTAASDALNSFRQKGDTRSVTSDPNGTSPVYSNEIVINTTTGDVWIHITGTTWLQSGAKGSIQVLIARAGGTWSIDGGVTWRAANTFALPLAVGSYTIQFGAVQGHTPPGNIGCVVEAYKTTIVVGTYT